MFTKYKGFKPYKANFNTTKSLHTYTYPDNWEDIRKQVLLRDKYTCQKCRKNFSSKRYLLKVHHIIPLSRGGRSTLSNLTSLCADCHKLEHSHLR